MQCKKIECSFREHNLQCPKAGTVKFSFFGVANEYFRLFITRVEENHNFDQDNQSSTTNQLVSFLI